MLTNLENTQQSVPVPANAAKRLALFNRLMGGTKVQLCLIMITHSIHFQALFHATPGTPLRQEEIQNSTIFIILLVLPLPFQALNINSITINVTTFT